MFKIANPADTVLMETKLCEEHIRTIRLRRNGLSPLGFAIRGGLEHGTGIYVSEVYSESEAEKEGLKPGDQILRVNGFSIEQAIHDEVISLIKSATKIILKVKSIGMIPVKENRADQIQWKYINDLQQKQTKLDHQTNLINNSLKNKQQFNKQQKNKSKCPIHSLKKEDEKIAKILLNNNNDTPTKLIQPKQTNSQLKDFGSAGSSPTSSVSSKCSSSSITSSSLSSCSKLIAKSCKSAISASSQKPSLNNKTKLNGYYSRSLSNLANSDFIDEFSLTSTSTINFTRNKSTSNLNLELVSSSLTPEQTTSSSAEDDSTLEKIKSNKYSVVYVNLSNRESLGCSVVKGPSNYPGIFVQTIKANGVAEKAGLEVGDQIVALNDSSLNDFTEAIEKIKSCKQMKFKVKKNTAIGLFLEQTVKNKVNRKLPKKTILNDISSSSSCNESSSSPVGHHLKTTNYRRSSTSSKNTGSSHLPYYMSKSSRHNANHTPNYLNAQFNSFKTSLAEQQSSHSSMSGSASKRSMRSDTSKNLMPLRKNIAHHRSYTSLKFIDGPPVLSSSTYGQRMNGYHSPVCLRHSSNNYYSQSENDYSMYEMEEQNDKKKMDLVESAKFAINNSKNHGYCKNSRQFKSKSIRNLSNRYDCDKCSCLNGSLNGYYAGSDFNDYEYHKKLLASFASPITPVLNTNLLKQKLLCNNLSCSNLTFKTQQTDIGLSSCQQLCMSMLNNQMNSLKLTQLNEEIKSKSNLELNEDLILNNKLYEKMRLEKERLALERKKLENEQLRLKEEKDKFELEKKQMENLKANEEMKSISSSSTTISTTSAAASQSINSSSSSATQSIGFLDEIKKLAELRKGENSLITDTLNKTRFSTGELKTVRLLPIADGKTKQLHHADDEKRKQHEILMMEFRQAHQKMFGKLTTNLASTTTTTTKSIEVSSVSTTTTNQIALSANKNQKILESSSLNSKTNESDTENINCNSSNLPASNLAQQQQQQTNNNLILTANTIANKIITPPPLPKFNNTVNTATNNGQDGTRKLERKLNTFGKLVVQNDNQNKLPPNVLPKNNLNGLNQNETVKILRTSSPNKTNHKKGLAPKPPISNGGINDYRSNDKLAKIIKVKKDENLYLKNSNKLEGQKNGSVVDYNGRNDQTNQTTVNNRSLEATKYTADLVNEKSNYLPVSDVSLSSSSIKS